MKKQFFLLLCFSGLYAAEKGGVTYPSLPINDHRSAHPSAPYRTPSLAPSAQVAQPAYWDHSPHAEGVHATQTFCMPPHTQASAMPPSYVYTHPHQDGGQFVPEESETDALQERIATLTLQSSSVLEQAHEEAQKSVLAALAALQKAIIEQGKEALTQAQSAPTTTTGSPKLGILTRARTVGSRKGRRAAELAQATKEEFDKKAKLQNELIAHIALTERTADKLAALCAAFTTP